MPLDRLVLILVAVVVAAGATVLVAATLQASLAHPVGLVTLIPLGLIAYIVLRVVAQRLANREDDRYDRIDR